MLKYIQDKKYIESIFINKFLFILYILYAKLIFIYFIYYIYLFYILYIFDYYIFDILFFLHKENNLDDTYRLLKKNNLFIITITYLLV